MIPASPKKSHKRRASRLSTTMPRFAFPLPGRSKKQTPAPSAPRHQPQQQQQHVTKAHKVLGSTYISIDSAKSWDGASNSGLSVSVSESTAPTTHSGGSGRRTVQNQQQQQQQQQHDWDGESGVLPRRIQIDGPDDEDELDGDGSDSSRVLREQPSSSTIKSWYDKSKQPLSVTQQTSASAMAKGLPPKAQRLLDVENNHSGLKNKKKPSKLDLSRLKGDSRQGKDWEASMLGNGYVNRSPSMVSPKTPNSAARYRQRLQKRPTKENLRRQQVEVMPQQISPTTGERVSPRCPPDMTELPSLYKHYEQTSFAMIMDQDLAAASGERRHPEPLLERPEQMETHIPPTRRREPAQDHQQWSQRTPDDEMPSPLRSHPPTPILAPTPQVVHVPTMTKHDQPSPTDCSASISSRHTRTSKASKHTEKSFQTADFIDKSVLMLSSDSEDDDDGKAYTELSAPAKRNAPSIASRPTSDVMDSFSMSSGAPSQSSGASPKADDSMNRQSNQTIRRTSTAPVGFLTIPTRFSTTSTQATTPSTDSNASPQWGTTFHSSSTPSVMSIASGSSRDTATSLQGADGYAIEEARAVQVRPVQAPARDQRPRDAHVADSGMVYKQQPETTLRQSRSLTMQAKGSSAVAGSVTTTSIPLTPEDVDFYIESRPQSGELTSSTEEHYMGLTRQEQMLITALRQRRESMRKGNNRRPDSKLVKGHQSQESEATITEESFNFSFPVPPKSKHAPRRSSSAFPSVITIPGSKDSIDESKKSVTADGTLFVLSPPPPSHLAGPKSAPKHSSRQTARMSEHEQMLLYLDHPGGPALAIKEGMMSPDTDSFIHDGATNLRWSKESLSPPYRKSLRRQRSNIETNPISTNEFSPTRGRQGSAPIMEESISPFPPPTRELPAPPTPRTPEQDEGVPRPDSPISSSFPGVSGKRRTINTQMARLSAFGPPKPGSSSVWLADD